MEEMMNNAMEAVQETVPTIDEVIQPAIAPAEIPTTQVVPKSGKAKVILLAIGGVAFLLRKPIGRIVTNLKTKKLEAEEERYKAIVRMTIEEMQAKGPVAPTEAEVVKDPNEETKDK